MSLLSEPECACSIALIHSLTCCSCSYVLQCLRLQFLRRSNDPLGPSILTFPESFSAHILHSDLNDLEVWPELGIVRSPEPVAAERPTRRAKNINEGTGLNYSETIVGERSGRSGAGMRVGGRTRSWAGKASSLKHRASQVFEGKGKARERQPTVDEEDEEQYDVSSEDEVAFAKAVRRSSPADAAQE